MALFDGLDLGSSPLGQLLFSGGSPAAPSPDMPDPTTDDEARRKLIEQLMKDGKLPQLASAGGQPDLSAARDAIAAIESRGSGDYNAVGPKTAKGDRAYGRYQVMGANIPQWTQAALGKALTPDQFVSDPTAQDAVFNHRFGGYVDKYGNVQDAASAWFTGRPLSQGGNSSDVLGTTGNQYVNKFMKALGQPSSPVATQVASADPSFVPSTGASKPMADTPDTSSSAAPSSFTDRLGGLMSDPTFLVGLQILANSSVRRPLTAQISPFQGVPELMAGLGKTQLEQKKLQMQADIAKQAQGDLAGPPASTGGLGGLGGMSATPPAQNVPAAPLPGAPDLSSPVQGAPMQIAPPSSAPGMPAPAAFDPLSGVPTADSGGLGMKPPIPPTVVAQDAPEPPKPQPAPAGNSDFMARQAKVAAYGRERDKLVARMANPLMDQNTRAAYQAKIENYNKTIDNLQPNEIEKALLASNVQPGTPDWNKAMRKKAGIGPTEFQEKLDQAFPDPADPRRQQAAMAAVGMGMSDAAKKLDELTKLGVVKPGSPDSTDTVQQLYGVQDKTATPLVSQADRRSLGIPDTDRGIYYKDSNGAPHYVGPQQAPGETAQSQKVGSLVGESLAKPVTDYIEGAKPAQDKIVALNAMQEAVKNPNLYQGALGDRKLALNKMLQGVGQVFGIQPNDVDSSANSAGEMLEKFGRQLAGAQAKSIGGARVTNFELDQFIKANPGITMTPQGNERLIGIMKQMAQRELDLGYKAQDYASEAGSKSNIADFRKKYVQDYDSAHPIVDPLSGRPLNSGTKVSELDSSPDQSPGKPLPATAENLKNVKKAPDGNWYVPDPSRPGKYLRVQP